MDTAIIVRMISDAVIIVQIIRILYSSLSEWRDSFMPLGSKFLMIFLWDANYDLTKLLTSLHDFESLFDLIEAM